MQSIPSVTRDQNKESKTNTVPSPPNSDPCNPVAMSVFQLKAVAKSYEWGSVGSQSKVAQYAQASPSFQVNETSPYAEVKCDLQKSRWVNI